MAALCLGREEAAEGARRNSPSSRRGTKPSIPVRIEGRTIAKSFWGRSWCANLERYSDFASRLPRGRTYVRNGSVLDLQIAKGEVRAQVSGSELYTVKIDDRARHGDALEGHLQRIAPAASIRWSSCCRAACPRASWTGCAGRATGCFPRPERSSCPAAALTGPTCASTSLPCSTASERGSTTARSFCSSCAESTGTICSHEPVKTVLCQDHRRPQLKCWMKVMSPPCSDWRWTPSRPGRTTLPARSISAPRRRNARTDPPDVRPPRARRVPGHAQPDGRPHQARRESSRGRQGAPDPAAAAPDPNASQPATIKIISRLQQHRCSQFHPVRRCFLLCQKWRPLDHIIGVDKQTVQTTRLATPTRSL